tara:strand:- start:7964 stop:8383 length:420 start_codon:yes stop_codon:yes gene_type:complete
MGTRSLTKVIETYKDKTGKTKKEKIICMYRQYDGYLTGHGEELASFLSQFTITNGISMEEKRKTANGMGCLSAQLVSHFKTDVGGIYLQTPDTEDVWEDYTYLIEGNSSDQLKVKVMDYEKKKIFEGTPNELLTHINTL